MNNDVVVEAVELSKIFNDQKAVDEISFQVKQGEFLGLLGPNGAGKTTTLRMLLGHVKPTSGILRVLDYDIPKEAVTMRRHIGVVPQHNNLDPDFTVEDNLYTYGAYFGLSRRNLQDRVAELLRFTALSNKAHEKVTALSGGMMRRLVLARALVNQPKLLILDEPTTGLDPQARQLIWQRLNSLHLHNTTMILTTHYLEEAERLCDRILVIDHGRILAEGSPRDLIETHIEPHVFEIYGPQVMAWYEASVALPVLRKEVIGGTVLCYCEDDAALLEELQNWQELNFIHRQANLEDVFLKLTGRELRE